MNKIFRILSLIGFLLIHDFVSGQHADTTVAFPEVVISESRPHLTGIDSIRPPILPLSTSLAGALRTHGNIYIKDYGPGSSATISMNGGKANEVSLTWDGITVSNPMLGLNDFSLITTGPEYKIQIADMTSASVLGAGAIAGAVLIDPVWNKNTFSTSVNLAASSMNMAGGRLHMDINNKKYQHQTTFAGQSAKNNFRYQDRFGHTKKMDHAQNHFMDGRHHSRFLLHPKTTLSASVWGRSHFREIPPTLTEVKSQATQKDDFIRNVLTLQHSEKNHIFNSKIYYGFQNQNYIDPNIQLDARHTFQNFQLKIDNHWNISPSLAFKYGLHENYFTSRSDNYDQVHTQNRFSSYGQILWNIHEKFKLAALVRPEWVSSQPVKWAANIHGDIHGTSGGKWTLHLNHNIAWPTLNDLYWEPGGNPSLLPEENWWTGISYGRSWSSNFSLQVKGYHRRSKNWIQWLPGKGGIWIPGNHKSARIYGAHLNIDYSPISILTTKFRYHFTRVFFPGSSTKKLQAIYTPAHHATAIAHFNILTQLSLSLQSEYTSTRYVLQDHSDALDPYFLISGHLQYTYSSRWKMTVSLYNVLNTQYQGVKNRPMPGRIIELNTQYKF